MKAQVAERSNAPRCKAGRPFALCGTFTYFVVQKTENFILVARLACRKELIDTIVGEMFQLVAGGRLN